MLSRIISPMYVLPRTRELTVKLWQSVHTRLERQGIHGLAAMPEFDDPLASGVVPDDVLLIQYCGFPYLQSWQKTGKLKPLACFNYAIEKAEPFTHHSVIVVKGDSPFSLLEALRGKSVVINGYDSNSGMNLLRAKVAPLAERGRFFGEVAVSGAHSASAEAVAAGRADVAALDAVTFAYLEDHDPALTAQLRVIDRTGPSPTLPLHTHADAPESLRQALLHAFADAIAAGEAPAGLRIRGVRPVTDADLEMIREYEAEAARLGYPELR